MTKRSSNLSFPQGFNVYLQTHYAHSLWLWLNLSVLSVSLSFSCRACLPVEEVTLAFVFGSLSNKGLSLQSCYPSKNLSLTHLHAMGGLEMCENELRLTFKALVLSNNKVYIIN